MKLGSLLSSGKDGLFALYKMKQEGHEIACIITIVSKNPDSYMFHTPNVELVKLQAEAMGIPLYTYTTEGEKEIELEDLKQALLNAKLKFSIEGITTGALFSDYQRERIDKVCKEIGLSVHSPLWHIDQEKVVRDIINSGFKFIITKVAAYGLDKSWLGRVITSVDVDKLVDINKKCKINIAFEGGEAETLVLDCPIFKSKIIVNESEVIMENECTGVYIIKKAELVEK